MHPIGNRSSRRNNVGRMRSLQSTRSTRTKLRKPEPKRQKKESKPKQAKESLAYKLIKYGVPIAVVSALGILGYKYAEDKYGKLLSPDLLRDLQNSAKQVKNNVNFDKMTDRADIKYHYRNNIQRGNELLREIINRDEYKKDAVVRDEIVRDVLGNIVDNIEINEEDRRSDMSDVPYEFYGDYEERLREKEEEERLNAEIEDEVEGILNDVVDNVDLNITEERQDDDFINAEAEDILNGVVENIADAENKREFKEQQRRSRERRDEKLRKSEEAYYKRRDRNIKNKNLNQFEQLVQQYGMPIERDIEMAEEKRPEAKSVQLTAKKFKRGNRDEVVDDTLLSQLEDTRKDTLIPILQEARKDSIFKQIKKLFQRSPKKQTPPRRGKEEAEEAEESVSEKSKLLPEPEPEPEPETDFNYKKKKALRNEQGKIIGYTNIVKNPIKRLTRKSAKGTGNGSRSRRSKRIRKLKRISNRISEGSYNVANTTLKHAILPATLGALAAVGITGRKKISRSAIDVYNKIKDALRDEKESVGDISYNPDFKLEYETHREADKYDDYVPGFRRKLK